MIGERGRKKKSKAGRCAIGLSPPGTLRAIVAISRGSDKGIRWGGRGRGGRHEIALDISRADWLRDNEIKPTGRIEEEPRLSRAPVIDPTRVHFRRVVNRSSQDAAILFALF